MRIRMTCPLCAHVVELNAKYGTTAQPCPNCSGTITPSENPEIVGDPTVALPEMGEGPPRIEPSDADENDEYGLAPEED